MKEVSWLHLSDLHAGMNGQGWLWPNLKHALFSDLRSLHSTNGPWDFVIFSGDLTQKASLEDYAKLSDVMAELWGVFSDLGFEPSLLCVPGNHDLSRPPKFQPEAMVLETWWSTPDEFRAKFWDKESPYLKLVNDCFDNYRGWLESLKLLGIKLVSSNAGVIVGDSSGVIEKEGFRLGIVGLNSAWLQLGGGDYKGRLHVDIAQAMNITEGDPEQWCASNDFNLLVTHHPQNWLHQSSQTAFEELIAPYGRFTCHMFGHMHEPNHKTTTTGGSKIRRELQAASLFGLERIQSIGVERVHGYSLNKIAFHDGNVELSFWPRKDRVVSGNRRVVGADPFFEFEVITEPLIGTRSPTQPPSIAKHIPALTLSSLASTSEGVLDAFALKIPLAPEHSNVRRVEAEKLIDALAKDRCAWVISEWGMGEDGFLWSLQQKSKANIGSYFAINMANFKSLYSFLEGLKSETGHSVEVLCSALENTNGVGLLLDDIPVDIHWSEEKTQELLKLAKIFLDFAPYINVIMRARVSPSNQQFSVIELKALDQGDTRLYVLEHPSGGVKYGSYDSVERIYRNTDGVPSVIDTALKNLSVTGLSSLSAISSDVAGKEVISSVGNDALKEMILDIGNSPDPALKKSYELLKVLTIFPQGEQLQRIKYLNPRAPFFYSSVHELKGRGLVSTVEAESLGIHSSSTENTIIVNRLAREVLINILNPAQFRELNRKASELYFGERTSQGVFKPPRSLRFDKPGRSSSEVSNAAVIIQRLAVDAASLKDKVKVNYVVELASFHASALFAGAYFKAVVDFFQDILPLLSEHISDKQHAYFIVQHASALRMQDGDANAERARDMFMSIHPNILDKSDRIQTQLNLALCHHSLKSTSDAISSAEAVIVLDKRSPAAVQAQWVILQNQPADDERESKLNELLKVAEKRKTSSVLNSLKLEKARKEKDPVIQRVMFESILQKATNEGDTYDAMRTVVALGVASADNHTPLDKSRLIQAYHYLYTGGFLHLFNSCHDTLWSIFEQEGDITNLLQLFKYSSLVWRLRGLDGREIDAINKLKSYVAGQAIQVSASNNTMAYYIFRSTLGS
ncbi:metallophosphoesterase family protein [Pseudomonas viridiflava]|uniref:metallophosphoesterase family protein n=2 Tax=Pseudomonas viridiflava TaxID=33069 RepID=UPI000F01A583|nr:metallophosphoesterase [Pseudomonas viridiflava]